MSTSRKKNKGGTVRTILSVGFVLLSGAAFGVKHYLSKNQAVPASAESVHIKAEFVDSNDNAIDSLQAGNSVKCDRAVKITQGEGYVRYNIELLDSDGTPLDQKLRDKLAEKSTLESMADPSLSSYRAFYEGICWATNDYNELLAKGDLVLNTFCRSVTEDVTISHPCSEGNLDELTSSGELEVGFEGSGMTVMKNDDEPFTRTVIIDKKLSAGDVCPLYDYIVLPIDWQHSETEYDGFMMNEEGDMKECIVSVNNMELIGEGFGIRVTADVVDAADYPNAATAFKSASK